MKKRLYALLCLMLLTMIGFGQTGHIMQGVGAVNMSMGGAGTAQPIDISGALLWNPASISAFKHKTFSANAGAFYSSPELSSSLAANMMSSSKSWKSRGGINGFRKDAVSH